MSDRDDDLLTRADELRTWLVSQSEYQRADVVVNLRVRIERLRHSLINVAENLHGAGFISEVAKADILRAVGGSATPTEARCRSMEDGTPLTCEFPAGHEGPHSFDPQPLCGTCGQPLENGRCFRYHPAAGLATPIRDES